MPAAVKMLQDITDRRIREIIRARIDQLAIDPDKQGKPLHDELDGYKTIRAVGQRYRVIFRVKNQVVVVVVVAIGIRREGSRKDVYALAKKLIRLGLLEPPA